MLVDCPAGQRSEWELLSKRSHRVRSWLSSVLPWNVAFVSVLYQSWKIRESKATTPTTLILQNGTYTRFRWWWWWAVMLWIGTIVREPAQKFSVSHILLPRGSHDMLSKKRSLRSKSIWTLWISLYKGTGYFEEARQTSQELWVTGKSKTAP